MPPSEAGAATPIGPPAAIGRRAGGAAAPWPAEPGGQREARPLPPPGFSRDLWLAWLLRPDVRGGGAEWDEAARCRFRLWWLVDGRHDYPGAAPLAPEEVARAFAPVPFQIGAKSGELPWLLAELWAMRSDLRTAFDGGKDRDLENLRRWFYVSGVRALRLFDLLPAGHLAMLREAVAQSAFPQLPLTRLMLWIWELRPDLQAGFPLAAERGVNRLVGWYYLFGAGQLELGPYVGPGERAALARPIGQDGALRLIDQLAAVYFFDGHAGEAPVHQARLWREGNPAAAPLRRLLAGEAGSAASLPPSPIGPPARRDGVNLIGFPRGQFGLGEDIRMAAAALDAIGVPYSVLAMTEHSDWRHHDPALDAHIHEEAPFALNLACLTGFEWTQRRLRLPPALWQGRRTIGWWPWELPRWPAAWRPAFELVDEVWAATRFAREAYDGADCPVPVVLMPPAVAVERIRPRSRAEFGLPDRRFLFALVFDGNSYLARKNPGAVVAAFREAFARGDEPVGLVVKGMNGAAAPGWRALASACAGDRRILLIDEIWPREDVLALIAACDALVSLHRAEGFGRLLAEAMLLEKPVIATGFSGNADFLDAASGFPVRWSPRRVRRDEYPFGEGQYWAEPDIAAAAATMRRLAADPAAARPIARAGRDRIRRQFCAEAAGRRMQERLFELGLEPAER